MAMRDYLAGEVAQDFSDGLLGRREALRRLGLLGLSVTAAGTLLAACGGPTAPPPQAPAPAAPVAPPGRVPGTPTGTEITFPGPAGELRASWAAPAGPPRGGVLVVHENRGLTPHFTDLVGRLAGAGYAALCVDLLSAQGGTGALTDPAQAPAALSGRPVEGLLADLRAGLGILAARAPGAKLGVVGFCFGGGLTWQLLQAGEARVAAALPFYGPAPEQPDFRRAQAAVLAVYGERDARVNATRERAENALRTAGLRYQVITYAGADHAFFNDTGARYDPSAAEQAWTAMVGFLNQYLA